MRAAASAASAASEITTLEGLPARWAKQRGLPAAEAAQTLHPVQQAWIDEQVPQCGFCQNGMMIKATQLLESTPSPNVVQIKAAFTSGRVAAPVPLRQLRSHPRRRAARGHRHGESEVGDGDLQRLPPSTCTARRCTRRQFVKTGGALVVGFGLVGGSVWDEAAEPQRSAGAKNSLDATLASSWFEIHADNTILIRTGKVDFGQTTAHTAYKQIVAEELQRPVRGHHRRS